MTWFPRVELPTVLDNLSESSEIGPAASSLELLQAVYSDPQQPLNRRMRAAIAALPFEHPKLCVTANIQGHGFAAKLEQAWERTLEVRPDLRPILELQALEGEADRS